METSALPPRRVIARIPGSPEADSTMTRAPGRPCSIHLVRYIAHVEAPEPPCTILTDATASGSSTPSSNNCDRTSRHPVSRVQVRRSEEHTSELQSPYVIS